MEELVWTAEWPTQPGLYFFFGDYTSVDVFTPKLKLCEVDWGGNGPSRFLMMIADGAFLYPREQKGLFARLNVKLPVYP